jgi:transposase
MTLYVALDVSLEKTAVCVMDADGTVIVERAVASDAAALAVLITALPERPERIAEAGFEAILMETRQIRAALSSMTVKTDRNDARGMAHLLRMGWFRPVHLKSLDAREQRTLLSARTTLVRRLRDIENSVRGLLRGFGFRFPRMLGTRWAWSVREALAGNPMLLTIIDPLLEARADRLG